MNFAYDIIAARAEQKPDDIAVRWHTSEGFVLEISNADLHHHSDVTAYYLQRMGVEKGCIVFLYDLETIFEFTTILTALHKLSAIPVFDLRKKPVERCNELNAYAVIVKNDSSVISLIDNNIHQFKTLEIKISVGFPYPKNWFDLHTGVRLAGMFKKLKNFPKNYTSLVVYDQKPIFYDNKYFTETADNYLWNNFYRSMIDNQVFEF